MRDALTGNVHAYSSSTSKPRILVWPCRDVELLTEICTLPLIHES